MTTRKGALVSYHECHGVDFCGFCGMKMTWTCAALVPHPLTGQGRDGDVPCGWRNRKDYNFCGKCGAAKTV